MSPSEIKVLLDVEAPAAISLNTGTPRPFPRVNGYVLVPSDEGFLVGQVEWITVERSPYPKRKGTQQDFGLIDLPFPLRKLSLTPLGTLSFGNDDGKGHVSFNFRRGVGSFPSVGDVVFLPTPEQLRSIVESGENRRVWIGNSPLAENAEVKVDPNRLFGRHLAVLGNTGSGKSCSVAGLIRWSLDAAKAERGTGADPNARFLILDPNGEYSRAFSSDKKARIFSVDAEEENVAPLKVPLWFWNSDEWCAFTQASPGVQRPLLRKCLREIKSIEGANQESQLRLRQGCSAMLTTIEAAISTGRGYEGWKFGPTLQLIKEDLEEFGSQFGDFSDRLHSCVQTIDSVLGADGQTYQRNNGTTGYNNFSIKSLNEIRGEIDELVSELGNGIQISQNKEDLPIQFGSFEFGAYLERSARTEGNPQFFDSLIMRVRGLLAEARMSSTYGTDGEETGLDEWLTEILGNSDASNGTVTIVDLSLVPAEVIHIITAVIARMTFEALQRYRKLHPQHKTLPTVLVMEEAHTFIKRYNEVSENESASSACCRLFERIAREGRKFGLGLVLSSQRPSELSPTVLSQCNTFLLHRISNDRDQELVQKLVPDNLRGLLRDLPSLPSQKAILMGWASELPILVKIRNLPDEQRPQSDDPDFWEVWTGKVDDEEGESERTVDWSEISREWQGRVNSENSTEQAAEPTIEDIAEKDTGEDRPDEDAIPF
ncbi:MAG: ATP-binding protein [Verrucomicrobiales bacterium]|nr:ATP-binding protein [Verrucomicrobiales bacterium]